MRIQLIVLYLQGGGGAVDWYSPTSAPGFQYSYFNACTSLPCCSMPSNQFGDSWQYARTGDAYVVFFFSYNNGGNIRWYIQTKLLDSLIANQCYYIEFYVNLYNPSKYGNNNVALLLSDTAIWADFKYKTPTANGLIPANPQIQLYNNPVITDTLNWVKIGGIYTAHGGEQYITIGNFKDDAHTDTAIASTQGYPTAYYIDDVSVIPLDSMQLKADAGRDTTIVKGDSVWIGSRLCGLQNVIWYDAGGNVIDTGAPGLWVKPTSNTFYVIEQNVCGQYSRDTVNIMVAPLPVVIKSYTVIASAAKQSVSNQWETSTEINTAYFNIQRSTDGLSFYTIGKVMAKGAGKYTFNDPLTIHDSRLTKLYYRLEIVDNNGLKTYSEIRSVFLTTEDSRFTISPNPSKDFVVISGGNIKQIKVNDLSGRTLLLSKEKKINISGLINGVYFISIETMDGNRVVEKLLKMP